jgi:hypothetical protein
MVSSYLDRDRGIVATVFINWTGESTPVSLAVEGGVVNGWIPYVTSSESDLGAWSGVPSDTTVLLPARSVVTLVGQVEESTDELIKGA